MYGGHASHSPGSPHPLDSLTHVGNQGRRPPSPCPGRSGGPRYTERPVGLNTQVGAVSATLAVPTCNLQPITVSMLTPETYDACRDCRRARSQFDHVHNLVVYGTPAGRTQSNS
jgi:hypothetical protein